MTNTKHYDELTELFTSISIYSNTFCPFILKGAYTHSHYGWYNPQLWAFAKTPLFFNYRLMFVCDCCDTVAKPPLPCISHGSFKLFKLSTSHFGTVGMHG